MPWALRAATSTGSGAFFDEKRLDEGKPVIEDPGLLRQIVRDRHRSLMSEVANDRLARSASFPRTQGLLVLRGAMTGLLRGAVVAISLARPDRVA
jgi:hypothetical protein